MLKVIEMPNRLSCSNLKIRIGISTLWWPSGKHNQLLSIDAESLFVWDVDTAKGLTKVRTTATPCVLGWDCEQGIDQFHDVFALAGLIKVCMFMKFGYIPSLRSAHPWHGFYGYSASGSTYNECICLGIRSSVNVANL